MSDVPFTTTGTVERSCGHVEARAHIWERVQKRVLPGGCATMMLQAYQHELEHGPCGECERKEGLEQK